MIKNMERLTKRSENGVAMYNTPSGDPVKWENNRHNVLQKLAEYEDLEEQNRLLILPVAVGDMVYCIDYRYTVGSECGVEFEESSCCGCVLECDSKREYYIYKQNVFNLEWIVRHMRNNSFGKTVFLTESEAIIALQALKEKV